MDRQRGLVKWFSAAKGYGFARTLNSTDDKDIFLHINCLPEGINQLAEGQAISFVVETTRKGPRAINVQIEA